MKTLTGKEVMTLLDEAIGFILDGDAILYAYPEEGDEEGEYVMEMSYTDGEGLTFEYEFKWKEDDIINVNDNGVLLTDYIRKEPALRHLQILEVKKL